MTRQRLASLQPPKAVIHPYKRVVVWPNQVVEPPTCLGLAEGHWEETTLGLLTCNSQLMTCCWKYSWNQQQCIAECHQHIGDGASRARRWRHPQVTRRWQTVVDRVPRPVERQNHIELLLMSACRVWKTGTDWRDTTQSKRESIKNVKNPIDRLDEGNKAYAGRIKYNTASGNILNAVLTDHILFTFPTGKAFASGKIKICEMWVDGWQMSG